MKIVKSKRVAPPHPEVSELINKLCNTPADDLASFIGGISEWKWPRSDLGNWIKVLNKFDAILQDIIRDYDVDKLQVNPFTPQTKATVLEILRFKRLLLENSTGRKLYASYDRLNSLLFTSDLDVLVADLKVILRPSQQYSAQPPSAQTTNISSARLISLAQSWTPLRDHGVELHDFLDSKKTPVELDLSGESGDVQFQFYRKSAEKPQEQSGSTESPTSTQHASAPAAPSSSQASQPPSVPAAGTKPPSGMTVIHIPGVATSDKDSMTILAEAVEKYDVPDEEKFELLCRIRIAKALGKGNDVDREKLVVARLLSIAIYAHTHGETQALNSLFLYDPELVNHIADLIHPDRDIAVSVQIASLIALDALGRYRAKISEVLTAVNAGVSHGILFSLLRKTVAQLQDQDSPTTSELAESLLTLIMLLTASPGGGGMIVGAGLIPLIIQILDNKLPSRLSVISKTTVLLDNALYGYGNAFQLFCNNSGVDTLVGRIAHEIDLDIKEFSPPEGGIHSQAAYGGLTHSRSSVLKHLLRSMQRMMQASGTSEGLRTLIDSSLPASVKKIMANRATFGPAIFAIAINLMSIFVHNEPTSLSILQEAHIPETFYDAIETGIEPALEVITALPNAIGALCLNPAGEAQFAARTKIIPSIFETFTSDKHIKVLGEKENAIVIGTALDELIRHHPSLKPQIFEGVQSMLQRIEDIGKTWTPPKGEESAYFLRSSIQDVESSEKMDVEPSSSTAPPPQPRGPEDEAVDEELKEEGVIRPENNFVLSFLDVAAKVLEGIFQYAPHCRDFIVKYDGIERLGRCLQLSALPVRFSETPAADSLIQIFRTMAELNNKETLSKLSVLVRNALDESKDYWETMSAGSKLAPFTNITAESDLASLNANFRKLVAFQIVVGITGDVYQSLGYSHARNPTSIMQVLSGDEAPQIIEDLGKAHRLFLWENILLKNAELQSKPATPPAESSEAPQTSSSATTSSAMVVVDLPKPQDESQPSKTTVGVSSTKEANARAVAYLIAQIPFSLTPFFQAIAKLFMTSRRIADSTSRGFSNAMAKSLANILLEHCKWGTTDDLKSNFAYSTLVISFITMLFRDDRSPQVHLHTLLLVMFTRAGGVEAIVSLGQRAADLVSKVASSAPDKGTDDEAAVAYAYGLLNVVVHLLGVLVAARPLLESSQTVPLITRDKDVRHPEYFEPHAFIVRMRHRVLPFLRELWQSTWLVNAPLPVVKSILGAIVEIMAADHEEAPSETIPDATLPSIQQLQAQLRPNNTPDEAAITQLVDMGFSRSSAERALMRSRNNVNAAAELLLSHPHLFPAIPPVTAEAAPAPPQDANPPPAPEAAPATNAPEDAGPATPPADGIEVAVAANEDMDITQNASDAPSATGPDAENESASTPDDGTRETSTNDQAAQAASGENEESAIVLEPETNWKGELDEARAEFRNQIISRAFSLTDNQPALVFEVKTAFVRLGKSQQERGLLSVLQVDDNVTSEILAARCRLLALILNDPAFPILQVSSSELQEVMDSVMTTFRRLPDPDKLSTATIPAWLAPYLLVAEALISLGDSITEVEVPTPEQDVPTVELHSGARFADERKFVFDLCLGLLKLHDLPRDEMLAVLRLLALLTKEYSIGAAFVDRAGPGLLLDHFKGSNKDALTYRSLGFTIIRHATEDASIVEGLMKHHLKRFFALSRNRLTDVGSMVKSTSPLALRDPATYVSACKTTCRLATLRPGSSTYTISLDADNKQPESQEKTDAMQVDANSKADPKLAEVIIHYVMSELLKVGKAPTSAQPSGGTEPLPAVSQLPTKEGGGSSSSQVEGSKPYEETGEYAYTCILMQLLAELLSSYDSCKVAFVSFHKRRSSGLREGTSKSRPAFLGFLLNEILAAHAGLPKEDPLKKPSLSSWATSIIVALCSDIYTTGNVKDASDELTAARKFVLDTLAKAMKEVSSGETPDVRYGRLYGLAELCYRLLSFRSPSPSGGKEETNIHIAKIMLEKNFVATLTAALADADLNYPGMKSLISAIMRPLEHLTKVAIKMGKASTKGKDGSEEHMETDSDSSDEEELEEAEGRDETPDLYRNSSLGMFGGDMEDVEFGEDDVEDMDEDDEDEDDAEMDYGDDDSSGTEPSTEDEEEVVDGMDVGMDDANENDWDEGEDHDESGEEDDEEDEIVEAVTEIVWQPNGEEAGGEDAMNAPQIEEGDEEAINDGDEGSLVSADEQGDDDIPSEEEIVLEFADGVGDDEVALVGGAWTGVAAPDLGGHRHTHSLVPPRRGRPIAVEDPYAYLGPSRRAAPLIDPTSHPLLVEPTENPQQEGTASSRHAYRRVPHGGVIASGGSYLDLLQTISQVMGGEGAQILHDLIAHGRGAAGGLQQDIVQEAGAILTTLERGLMLHHHHHSPSRGDRRSRTQSIDPAQFTPQGTLQRWAEELKLLNPSLVGDRLTKLTGHVAISLLPAAKAADQAAKEEMARVEAERKREEEVKRVEEAKKEEERQRELREEEERQAAARRAEEEAAAAAAAAEAEAAAAAEAEAAAAAAAAAAETAERASATEDVVMSEATENPAITQEGSSSANAEVDSGEPSSSTTARVTILVHGNAVDITDTGIDVEFLEALPDDMREEIINQHFREHRSTTQPERPEESQISPEFLEALPPDIRAEILQQEMADRTRRERAAAAAQTAQQGGPSDIDTADFLASLDPALRQTVLMEQDEGFLQTLPSALLAEVSTNPMASMRRHLGRPTGTSSAPPAPALVKKAPSPRDAVQLLDKSGVSALVRLLFAPQAHKRSSIHKVLINLCENSKTRFELLNILLTVLQNGTADLSAVDKGFSQMSVRAGRAQTPKTTPKKSVPDTNLSFIGPTGEGIPNLAAQRCLEALISLVNANELCSLFFLSEQELPAGLKRNLGKKGKGKEKVAPQTHYPIVLLLGLLDKPIILKAPSLMDLVAGLLASVTRPLTTAKEDTVSPPAPTEPEQATETAESGRTQEAGTEVGPSATSPEVPTTTDAIPKAAPESQKQVTAQPQIPHSVLRLIVNILTVGECSARTFQQTLSLIQHLSFLPDARDTIASELRSKAQELGSVIYSELEELQRALETAPSGDSVPSTVITKFSPASSDQAKLLRVLKTIDYMYTSKAFSTAGSAATPDPKAVSEDQEKAQAIYQTFRFNSLWNKLGDCLTLVSEKSDSDHIATVLLPLIESLMVVCKYVSGVGLKARAMREPMSPRSPTTPRESTEDLFVAFTDAHRKILNSMVRNNPSLMSGSFSLLVNNPRVLDFDNKRNYFTQKLRRRPANREQYGTLQVNVRRQRVFEDSFQHLQRQTGDQIKYGKLSVRFYDEEGVDAGGVTREWFQILARQMFNPDYALFQPCAADRLTYQPNQASWVNSEHLSFFKFVGRIIGKAIFDGRLLDAYFARSLYRQMLGKPVDYRDVEWVDPEYYKSLVWILENDPTILDLTFSVESNAFGLTKVVPLKEGGQSIPVTNENKREYVQLSAEYRLVLSIKEQIEAFLSGFYDIIPKDLIAIFNEQELELLISGTPDIDVDEWRAATDYHGYTSADPVIVWWWRALKSFNRDERAKVLSFATGTSKVPLGGFTELQGVQGVQRFSIHKAYGDLDRLPQAHTCFNQIDLPQYTSYEKLRTQLLLAINEGGEGFGFA